MDTPIRDMVSAEKTYTVGWWPGKWYRRTPHGNLGSSIFATIEPRLCYLRFVSEISLDDWTGPSWEWSGVHESCLKRAGFNVSFRWSPTSGDHYWPSETSWSQLTGTEEAVKATATLNNKEEENRFVFLNSCPRFSTFSRLLWWSWTSG